jgi:hypothetical protein
MLYPHVFPFEEHFLNEAVIYSQENVYKKPVSSDEMQTAKTFDHYYTPYIYRKACRLNCCVTSAILVFVIPLR